ncbi:hypothetical protein AVEN_177261-1 [Araneus ventricosus]|uniref:Uncharacterized protein n=1 Tax=Araneus ventricosus TaxID=182803 RepID=A0A4Y2GZ00_ARAVE|nr:hypothetical protein AVEN_177261-1 [Araneus ventricosus]
MSYSDRYYSQSSNDHHRSRPGPPEGGSRYVFSLVEGNLIPTITIPPPKRKPAYLPRGFSSKHPRRDLEKKHLTGTSLLCLIITQHVMFCPSKKVMKTARAFG